MCGARPFGEPEWLWGGALPIEIFGKSCGNKLGIMAGDRQKSRTVESGLITRTRLPRWPDAHAGAATR
jgi:hypothetical protein